MAAKGTLEVHLHGGKEMRNVEFFGKNDPYALLSYKTQDQKSKTLEGGGSDPIWDQSFFFQVEDGDDSTDVIIKIFDEDDRSKDDAIGEAKIPIGRVIEELEVPASSYDLVCTNGKTQGQVEVSLKFVPSEQESKLQPLPFHPDRPHHPHANHFNPAHHGSNGPYGDSNEGGWQ
ncbi:hypothetical protein GOP47_0020720 [Adiantum capillus-veneris]|uniref:C2 domain-containing protein n=1 Tax=Adiantum capillus-veneris TaxID=13818 RepID=A0A9D4UA89_ADICA|nr:hypothetical protein GOP47_0020720 [Adiantum capillus-veneris]